MSIVTNRSNVYIMSPATKYGDISADWGPFMENDFTIYIKSKILVDRIEKKSHPFQCFSEVYSILSMQLY